MKEPYKIFKLRRYLRHNAEKFKLNQICIYLSLRCNLDCPHCGNLFYNGIKPSCPELNFNSWQAIFKDWSQINEIHITGGEPALHKDFISIIGLLSKEHFVFIYTNLIHENLLFIKPNKNIMIVASRHPGMNPRQQDQWAHNCNILKKRFQIQIKALGQNTPIEKSSPDRYRICYKTIGPWVIPDGKVFLIAEQAFIYMFSQAF